MKFRDALNFSTRMVFVIMYDGFFDLHQVDQLLIFDLLIYLIIPHINVLYPLVMHMILRKMNNTLTVAMNPN